MSQRQQAASYEAEQCCSLREFPFQFSLGSVQDASATIKNSVLLNRSIRPVFKTLFSDAKSGTQIEGIFSMAHNKLVSEQVLEPRYSHFRGESERNPN